MLQITLSNGRLGPFQTVDVLADAYYITSESGAPGVLPMSVYGVGIVAPWVGPLPTAPAPDLGPLKAEAVARIDADVDAIYAVVIGNRQAEYEAAERQAQEFADGGFLGQAPAMVASWATAKGWTGQQAAQDILTVAAQWRGAQEQIRAQRLLRKEAARAAATQDVLTATMQAWTGFVAAARAQLGLGAA